MFNNIGKKIKGLASIFTWVGISLSIIFGFISMAMMPPAGILIIIIGSLVSWCGSFVLYGFGQLIETNEDNAHYAKEACDSLKNIDIKLRNLQYELLNTDDKA